MTDVCNDKKIVLLSRFELVSNRIQISNMTLAEFDLFPSNGLQISVNISSPAPTGLPTRRQLQFHSKYCKL